jgi:hypothetical protein
VIEKSHRHFAELGIDENILIELQQVEYSKVTLDLGAEACRYEGFAFSGGAWAASCKIGRI